MPDQPPPSLAHPPVARAALLASDQGGAASSVARYRRDRRGETVHRADCKSLRGRGTRWDYADGMTADEMLRTLAANRWLVPCKVCRPDEQEKRNV